ncbi:MAG: anti-sigma regulatory factor [Gammaproteobacteria bacterium]|uniref:Serine/threonine-protein kinase RsbT n=2 Tax=Pseudacidovorax intermedius TaxID=433924 RepID=A0A370FHV3_9BURK|nr:MULTISPECIES: anti-sigma regulatory factor [Pseudacidovorax]MBP6897232.1 anti-sigma regulatory factor [Pseudacidovorax sp.]RDI26148.1 serine/threonine-protein kinase RsbT [Pseudacidovorax intermedius]
MAPEPTGTLPLASEQHIVASRQTVRALCQELRFSLVEQTKMVTAASELSRNTLIHGGGGRMHWAVLQEGARRGLQLRFEDEGPGIANIDLAMSDGYTSGGGMGLGLPGSKRLVNDFDIRSTPGQGTCVSIVKWK